MAGDLCLITRSGCYKSVLTPDDPLVCSLDGRPAEDTARPSAETPLHLMLYGLDSSIGAVLHTHSVHSTLLSMEAETELRIADFEMQKALTGVATHEAEIAIPVFANDQDMHALAGGVSESWRAAGHGLYAWGKDVADARRHVEGFEFLFENTHGEDEVRFFVSGDGIFNIHHGDRVFALLCEQNDLISVPASTRHWFDMGPNPDFTVLRLFNNPDRWIAQFTGDAIANSYPRHDN